MAKIQNTANTKCWQSCGRTGILIHCWWECKMAQLLWEPVWQFLTKLSIPILYSPSFTLLGIYPDELKHFHTNICIEMCIAALFTIANTL